MADKKDYGFGETHMGHHHPEEPLTKEQKLEKFLDTMYAQRSINLPALAIGVKLEFCEVEAELRRGGEFFNRVESMLDHVKFDLWESVLRIGRDGKASGQRVGDLPAIRFIIEEIESGRILKKYRSRESRPEDLEEARAGLAKKAD